MPELSRDWQLMAVCVRDWALPQLAGRPLTLVRCAARACDPLGPAAPITSIQLRMLVEGTSTPSNAIETVFGIRPLPFEEGLRRFLR